MAGSSERNLFTRFLIVSNRNSFLFPFEDYDCLKREAGKLGKNETKSCGFLMEPGYGKCPKHN